MLLGFHRSNCPKGADAGQWLTIMMWNVWASDQAALRHQGENRSLRSGMSSGREMGAEEKSETPNQLWRLPTACVLGRRTRASKASSEDDAQVDQVKEWRHSTSRAVGAWVRLLSTPYTYPSGATSKQAVPQPFDSLSIL